MKKMFIFILFIFINIFILQAQMQESNNSSNRIEIVEKGELYKLPNNCQFYTVSNNQTISFVNQKEGGYGTKTINIIYDSGETKKIVNENCKIFQLKFSPDNKWFSYGERKRDGAAKIKLYNLADNFIKTIENGDKDCGNLDFSPDSKKFVYTRYLEKRKTRNMEIVISDFSGTETILIQNANFPKWSPNGDKIAVSKVEPVPNSKSWISYIWIYNLQNKHEIKLNHSNGMASAKMCWSPDGNKISAHNGKNLGIINILNDRRIDVGEIEANSPSWSPDGLKLIFTQPIYKDYSSGVISDSEILLVNADGNDLVNLTTTLNILEASPFWISENEIIYTIKKNGINNLIKSRISSIK